MTKLEWIKLADAFIKEAGYWSELYETKIKLAKKHHIASDFIGNDYFSGPLTSTIEDLLGEDFCYWLYDCGQSYKLFNEKTINKDGTHPDVQSLGELYDYWEMGR